MADPKEMYYQKRAEVLVQNLKHRHFEAYYCSDRDAALKLALDLIPPKSSVAWGGAMSAGQIGLLDALSAGDFDTVPDHIAVSSEEELQKKKDSLFCDVFISGANALSLDGQMVNIDGTGNRVAATIYGPKSVIIIAGMNKVEANLEAAIHRARNVAAPMNIQRFDGKHTPCMGSGVCADCRSEDCICNQIVITRHCRPSGRIKFILIGEDLGM